MNDAEWQARVLVVAATARELAPPAGWLALQCGVGPVEAAAATARALAELRPSAVVHVGIAGARRDSTLTLLQLVIGSGARYNDLGVPERLAPSVLTADARLIAAARVALPTASTAVIGTSGRVGGTTGCDVEAMEGFAVLRAAQLAGIPAIEVRAISNYIDEPDRTLWRFDDAFSAIIAATPRLVAEVARCVS